MPAVSVIGLCLGYISAPATMFSISLLDRPENEAKVIYLNGTDVDDTIGIDAEGDLLKR